MQDLAHILVLFITALSEVIGRKLIPSWMGPEMSQLVIQRLYKLQRFLWKMDYFFHSRKIGIFIMIMWTIFEQQLNSKLWLRTDHIIKYVVLNIYHSTVSVNLNSRGLAVSQAVWVDSYCHILLNIPLASGVLYNQCLVCRKVYSHAEENSQHPLLQKNLHWVSHFCSSGATYW